MSTQDVKLQTSDEVNELLESRGIRVEDVEQVIQNAEEKGEKLYRSGEDRHLAKLGIGEATFYVEYSPAGEGIYLIHTAYTHRATMEE